MIPQPARVFPKQGGKPHHIMMLNYPISDPYNFSGLKNQKYEDSKVVILPVPYDSTTYWRSGTKAGPQAIIEASRHLELYDIELSQDFSEIGIYTLPELEPSKDSPFETIKRIEDAVSQILKDKKFLVLVGGEHSVSLGSIRAFKKGFPDFSVLQLDAHTDSRNEFQGTKYHHACVMRRVHDELSLPITHVGIRSVCEEEIKYFQSKNITSIFYSENIDAKKVLNTLADKVYVSIDLDVFDPSIMPSVGTPEPNGLGWHEVLSLLKRVAKEKEIIGFDTVEFCPIPGFIAPDFTAAKLIYKLIGYIFYH